MNASAALDTSPKPTRHAPLSLWRVAEAFMHILYNLFGAPEDVAFRHTLTREPYELLASWLRCAEAMLRRLLVIEAAAYAKPNTPPRLWPQRQRVRRARGFDADKPEQWRVSFRCFQSSPARGGSAERRSRKAKGEIAPSDAFGVSSPTGGGDVSFHSAWPLAERYEALIRVFNNPEPYARRLAARLHAQPHRLREPMRAPEEARHRVDRFEEMGMIGDRRWLPNTS